MPSNKQTTGAFVSLSSAHSGGSHAVQAGSMDRDYETADSMFAPLAAAAFLTALMSDADSQHMQLALPSGRCTLVGGPRWCGSP